MARALARALPSVLALALLCPAGSGASTPAGTPISTVSVEGEVHALARAGDAVYLGGSFKSVTRWTGSAVALDAAGNPTTTPPMPQVEGGAVHAVVEDGAGGRFIGGDFTRVAGQPITRLAHIDATGALDTSFDPNPGDTVRQLLFDGTSVYAGGDFGVIDGQTTVDRLAKLNPATGAADPTFNPEPTGAVYAMSSDGTYMYVGGDFAAIDGQSAVHHLARVNLVNGTVDPGFNPNPTGTLRTVRAIVWSGTNNLWVGGTFTSIDGNSALTMLAKVNRVTGVADTAFDPNPTGEVSALSYDGASLFVGGRFGGGIGGVTGVPFLAKLNGTTGVVSTSFNPQPSNGEVLMLYDSGGSIYAGGTFVNIDGQSATPWLAKMDRNDGTVDTSYAPRPDGVVRTLKPGPNDAPAGTLIAGGAFHRTGPRANTVRNLAKIDLATGALDLGFTPNPDAIVRALLYDGTSLFVAGNFGEIGGQMGTNSLARLDPLDGDVDTTFNPAPQNASFKGNIFALEHDGTSLYAAGGFSTIDGQGGTPVLAKMSPVDGTVDTNFDPKPGGSDGVYTLLHDGTNLFVGGGFTVIDGETTVDRLAKLNPADGTVDRSFRPLPNSFGSDAFGSAAVYDLWLDGTSLYAAGHWETIDQQNGTRGLAKLDAQNGLVDVAFHPNPSMSRVNALWHDGTSLYAGGDFGQIGQSNRRGLARLNPQTGAADATFDPDPLGDDPFLSLGDPFWEVFALTGLSTTVFAGGEFDYLASREAEGFGFFGPQRPANTAAPTLTGTAQPGGTLTCSAGAWTDATLGFTRRWLVDGSPVAGATAPTYVVQAGDVGKQVACEVTARNGTGPSAPATSAAVTVQPAPADPGGGDPGGSDPPPSGGTDPPPGGTDPPPGGTDPPPGTDPVPSTLSAAATLRRAKLTCRRAKRNGRKILRCTLKLPPNAAPARTIRATARSRTRVVARRKLHPRAGVARFAIPRSSRKLILRLGGAKVTRRVRISR
jgi:hypothetical protein